MSTKEEVPFGDPTSTTCRWCEASKVARNGGLICPTCDGGLVKAGESS